MWQEGVEASVQALQTETNTAERNYRRAPSNLDAPQVNAFRRKSVGTVTSLRNLSLEHDGSNIHDQQEDSIQRRSGYYSSTALVLSAQSESSSVPGLSDIELQEIDARVNTDITAEDLDEANELWEDTRSLVRRTLRAAEDTLYGSHYGNDRTRNAANHDTTAAPNRRGSNQQRQDQELDSGWKKIAKAWEELEEEKKALVEHKRWLQKDQNQLESERSQLQKTNARNGAPLSFTEWKNRELPRVKALWARERSQIYADKDRRGKLGISTIMSLSLAQAKRDLALPENTVKPDRAMMNFALKNHPGDILYASWVYYQAGLEMEEIGQYTPGTVEERWKRDLRNAYPGNPYDQSSRSLEY
jgi:hypothetical protein